MLFLLCSSLNPFKTGLILTFLTFMTFLEVSGVSAEMHGFATFAQSTVPWRLNLILPLNVLCSKQPKLLISAVFSSSPGGPGTTAIRRDRRSRPTRGNPLPPALSDKTVIKPPFLLFSHVLLKTVKTVFTRPGALFPDLKLLKLS